MKLLLCRDEWEGPDCQWAQVSRLPTLLCSFLYFSYTHCGTWTRCSLKEDALLALGVSVIRCLVSPHQGCLTATSQALLCQPPLENHTMDATPLQVFAEVSGLVLPLSLNSVLTANTLSRLLVTRELIVPMPSSLSFVLSNRWGLLRWLYLAVW